MTSHLDALIPYKLNTIDRQPPLSHSPLLMCPFCDATFADDITWRSHASEHIFNNTRPVFPCRTCHKYYGDAHQLQQHFVEHTATQSTQTHDVTDVDASEKTDFTTIKNELQDAISDTVDNTHFNDVYDDAAYFDVLDVQQVKLEPTIRMSMQEQLLNLPTAFVALDRLDDNVVQKHVTNQRDKHRRRRKYKKVTNETSKRSANAKLEFAYPTAPVQCAMCCEIVCDLFPTKAMEAEEFERTKNIVCRLCGYNIRQLTSVPLHYRRVHMNESDQLSSMVACNMCMDKNVASLRMKNENTDDTWIKCELCPKMNRTQLSFRNHMRKDHMDRRVYLCPHCASLIIGRVRFKTHIFSNHVQSARPQPEERYQCEQCGKVLHVRGSMVAHLRNHLMQRPHPCPLCPIVTKTASNLKQHMQQHIDSKNITCDVCGRRFRRIPNWRTHMLSHTGERPYDCEECGRSFRSKSNVNAHMRTHTGEKPFACDKCDKRYRELTDLRRHKRVHGGVEKTHICGICDKRYYEAKYLREHLMSAHKTMVASM